MLCIAFGLLLLTAVAGVQATNQCQVPNAPNAIAHSWTPEAGDTGTLAAGANVENGSYVHWTCAGGFHQIKHNAYLMKCDRWDADGTGPASWFHQRRHFPRCGRDEAKTCQLPLRVTSMTVGPTPFGPGFVVPAGESQIVTYTCNDGYKNNAGVVQSTCEFSGWDPPIPNCVPIGCSPQAIPHATFTPTGGAADPDFRIAVGGTLTYQCEQFFHVQGEHETRTAALTCEVPDQWSGEPPVCEGYCVVQTIEHGRPTFTLDATALNLTTASEEQIQQAVSAKGNITVQEGNWTTIGLGITFKCDEGYYCARPKIRICRQFGTWSPEPECVFDRRCRAFTVPNTTQSPENNTLIPVGERVFYNCSVPHTTFDENNPYGILTCGVGNNFSQPIPRCVPTGCATFPIHNTIRAPPKPDFEPGENLTFTCKVGFALSTGEEDAVFTCQFDETWTPTAVPVCNVRLCQVPALEANVQSCPHSGAFLRPGGAVFYRCPPTFERDTGQRQVICGQESGWIWGNTSHYTCKKTVCHVIPHPIAYGQQNINGTIMQIGDEYNYTCDSEYFIDLNITYRCEPKGYIQQYVNSIPPTFPPGPAPVNATPLQYITCNNAVPDRLEFPSTLWNKKYQFGQNIWIFEEDRKWEANVFDRERKHTTRITCVDFQEIDTDAGALNMQFIVHVARPQTRAADGTCDSFFTCITLTAVSVHDPVLTYNQAVDRPNQRPESFDICEPLDIDLKSSLREESCADQFSTTPAPTSPAITTYPTCTRRCYLTEFNLTAITNLTDGIKLADAPDVNDSRRFVGPDRITIEPEEADFIKAGAVITYHCGPNRTRIGTYNTTCTQAAGWAPGPDMDARPICERIDWFDGCKYFHVNNSHVRPRKQLIYPVNATLSFECKYLFTLQGNNNFSCCEGRVWKLDCSQADAVANPDPPVCVENPRPPEATTIYRGLEPQEHENLAGIVFLAIGVTAVVLAAAGIFCFLLLRRFRRARTDDEYHDRYAESFDYNYYYPYR